MIAILHTTSLTAEQIFITNYRNYQKYIRTNLPPQKFVKFLRSISYTCHFIVISIHQFLQSHLNVHHNSTLYHISLYISAGSNFQIAPAERNVYTIKIPLIASGDFLKGLS